jgi:HD-GYP domain-containing protein (c-di-GMP phosphodiesterase class II)
MIKQVEDVLRKYPEVYRHSCAVRDLATNFAFFLGYSYKEAMKIRLGGYIHDVGKSFIEPDILLKQGKLTPYEYEIVKTHSRIGYDFLQNHNYTLDKELLAIVLQHHEREDGTGYPFSLVGEEVHPYAKLISLCDVYDVITSTRSYKVAYSSNYAFFAIEEGMGTQFNYRLGEQFLLFMKNNNDISDRFTLKKARSI